MQVGSYNPQSCSESRFSSSGLTVAVHSAGYGGLGLSIEGPSKVDINCEDMEDGTCKVTYCPTEPGNYIINIKFADQHVPGTDSCHQLNWVSWC